MAFAAADGAANERIAASLGIHRMTALPWRGRFERERPAGLADAPRPGREPVYDRAARDRVSRRHRSRHPWDHPLSSRRLAARTGISTTTILRIWTAAGLEPQPEPTAG